MMFFVLSGFVLSLPQIGGKRIDYLPYLLKRVCRIYLPYLAALAFAVLACWKWHGRHSYGSWVDSSWPQAPQWHSILQHLLLIGNYPNIYNGSFWTLVHEMRVCLVFPFVCVLAIQVGPGGCLALALALLLLGGLLGIRPHPPSPIGATVSYTGMFVVGIFLARWLPQMRDLLRSLNPKQYWALFLFSVFIYAYAPSVFYARHWNNAAWNGFTTIGAAGLILFSLVDRNIGALLHHPFIMFLGKISYSIYLLHMPILLTFGYIFYKKSLPILWLGPYLLTTIVLAAIMYYAVEVPSITLGRKLAGKLSQTKPVLPPLSGTFPG